jgi:hypothetical protein
MHKEILTKEQIELLPLLNRFSRNFGMVGGTAIALYIGHRESIDFDLFSMNEFDNYQIKRKISKYHKIERVIKDEIGQYTLIIKGVGVTFFHYPYKIKFSKNFDNVIKLPCLLSLAAMKLHALGRRAKWKDYVDIYFIMKNYYTIGQIIKKTRQIFGSEFNEKLLRVQLSYFKDIDYGEKIIYLNGFEVSDKIIQKELIKYSLS